jgi:hypothetical protein
MDLIITGGRLRTMSPGAPEAQAVAVRSGRIAAVGRDEEIRPMAAEGTRIVELRGKTVLPGFIDPHNHFCQYALMTAQVDCRPSSGCVRGDDVIEALKERAQRTPPGRWVMGWGYASYLLDDRKHLTREDLDRASKDHPLCLIHVSFHEAVVNSRALDELGIDRETPDPPGGLIHRDSRGEPNGVLSETAFMGPLFFQRPSIYSKVLGTYTPDERARMFLECALTYASMGIVGVHDPFVDGMTFRAYQDAQETEGLPIRIYAYILNHMADSLLELGLRQGFGSEMLRIGAVKVFLDGGMSSRTAAVLEPYESGGGTGILNFDQQALNQEIERLHSAGHQISVHAQGDRALEMLVEAFSRVLYDGNPLRHHIVHAGAITPSQIQRAASMGLGIISQANFFSLLGDGFLEAFGPERSQRLYPFRSLLECGVKLALSSDCPVADPDPLVGIRDAVLRKTPSGRYIAPQEALGQDEAVALYTREAAYFSFDEHRWGTIEPGKWADMVVLEGDPLSVAAEEIPACGVKMTIVGGKVVHEAKA